MVDDEFLRNDAVLTQELLSLAFGPSGIAVFKVDPKTRQVQLTSAMKQILGLELEQKVDYEAFSRVIHPEDADAAIAKLAAAIKPDGPGACEIEFRIVTPAGETRWVAVRGRAFFDEGEARAANLFIGTVRDTTERRRAEAVLEEAVAHQEVLLHEVNHRVKNSLQLVSSLMRLQARRMPDQEARRQLEDATSRISAIAHVHQRLYRDRDIKRINFGAFVSELCADLQGGSPSCALRVTAPTLFVNTDRAVPLALVINELVTNAFKYAYPGGGPVAVAIEQPQAGQITITVSDDGVGLPEGFCVETEGNLGMILIASMLTQLAGRIDVRARPRGATFVVSVPIDGAA